MQCTWVSVSDPSMCVPFLLLFLSNVFNSSMQMHSSIWPSGVFFFTAPLFCSLNSSIQPPPVPSTYPVGPLEEVSHFIITMRNRHFRAPHFILPDCVFLPSILPMENSVSCICFSTCFQTRPLCHFGPNKY